MFALVGLKPHWLLSVRLTCQRSSGGAVGSILHLCTEVFPALTVAMSTNHQCQPGGQFSAVLPPLDPDCWAKCWRLSCLPLVQCSWWSFTYSAGFDPVCFSNSCITVLSILSSMWFKTYHVCVPAPCVHSCRKGRGSFWKWVQFGGTCCVGDWVSACMYVLLSAIWMNILPLSFVIFFLMFLK